jgi:AhpC/TSA family
LHFPLVVALLSEEAVANEIFNSRGARLVLEPDRKVDQKTLHSLLVERDGASKIRLLIESDTKLIKQIQEILPIDLARVDAEDPPRQFIVEKSWSASSIETKAAMADLFKYRPPQDFKRVGNFKGALVLAEATMAQPLAVLLGKPAPDFALNVVDNSGSTRKVSKADLAGKVVVIAYWSIQHEPCSEELREIRKIVQAAGRDDKAVLVALNVDQDPDDIKESGARARQTLAEKKVGIEGARGCMVAVDPSGMIAEALPVAGLPAVVLLDGKGIVQASHTGNGPELTGSLRKEIETLLVGKSLERPELKLPAGFDADESKPTVLTEASDAITKIEELGGTVILADGGGGASQVYVQLADQRAGDEVLAKLVPHLKQVTLITGLHLQNTRITDAGLEQLKGMTNVFSMNLEGTAITDRGLGSLKSITSLKFVHLTGTQVTDGGIQTLKQARPDLQVKR